MLYHEIERSMCIVRDEGSMAVLDPTGETKANGVLCFAYTDHTAGLTYETMGLVFCVGDDYTVVSECKHMGLKIRANGVMFDDVRPIHNRALLERFQRRIRILDLYYKNEDVAVTRTHKELDGCRHPYYPDDVCVGFLWQKKTLEKLWVRCERCYQVAEGQTVFAGRLLNEPDFNFGFHQGDEVEFVATFFDNEWICLGIVEEEQNV